MTKKEFKAMQSRSKRYEKELVQLLKESRDYFGRKIENQKLKHKAHRL